MRIQILSGPIFTVDGVIHNSDTFSEKEFMKKFGKSKKDFFRKKLIGKPEKKLIGKPKKKETSKKK